MLNGEGSLEAQEKLLSRCTELENLLYNSERRSKQLQVALTDANDDLLRERMDHEQEKRTLADARITVQEHENEIRRLQFDLDTARSLTSDVEDDLHLRLMEQNTASKVIEPLTSQKVHMVDRMVQVTNEEVEEESEEVASLRRYIHTLEGHLEEYENAADESQNTHWQPLHSASSFRSPQAESSESPGFSVPALNIGGDLLAQTRRQSGSLPDLGSRTRHETPRGQPIHHTPRMTEFSGISQPSVLSAMSARGTTSTTSDPEQQLSARLKAHAEELARVQEERDSLSRQLAEKAAAVVEAEQQMSAKADELTQLRQELSAQLEAKSDEFARVQEEKDTVAKRLDDTIAAATESKKTLTAQLQGTADELSRLQKEKDAVATQLEEEKDALATQLAAKSTTAGDVEQQLSAQLEAKTVELIRLQKECDSLSQQLADITAAATESEASLNAQLQDKAEELTRVQDDLSARLQTQANVLERVQNEKIAVSNQLTCLQEERDSLSLQLAEKAAVTPETATEALPEPELVVEPVQTAAVPVAAVAAPVPEEAAKAVPEAEPTETVIPVEEERAVEEQPTHDVVEAEETVVPVVAPIVTTAASTKKPPVVPPPAAPLSARGFPALSVLKDAAPVATTSKPTAAPSATAALSDQQENKETVGVSVVTAGGKKRVLQYKPHPLASPSCDALTVAAIRARLHRLDKKIDGEGRLELAVAITVARYPSTSADGRAAPLKIPNPKLVEPTASSPPTSSALPEEKTASAAERRPTAAATKQSTTPKPTTAAAGSSRLHPQHHVAATSNLSPERKTTTVASKKAATPSTTVAAKKATTAVAASPPPPPRVSTAPLAKKTSSINSTPPAVDVCDASHGSLSTTGTPIVGAVATATPQSPEVTLSATQDRMTFTMTSAVTHGTSVSRLSRASSNTRRRMQKTCCVCKDEVSMDAHLCLQCGKALHFDHSYAETLNLLPSSAADRMLKIPKADFDTHYCPSCNCDYHQRRMTRQVRSKMEEERKRQLAAQRAISQGRSSAPPQEAEKVASTAAPTEPTPTATAPSRTRGRRSVSQSAPSSERHRSQQRKKKPAAGQKGGEKGSSSSDDEGSHRSSRWGSRFNLGSILRDIPSYF